jgi:molybdenum cofactor biosynthesis enzyme MoaA
MEVYKNMRDLKLISSETKIKARVMPFVTFPLTKKCNFRCQYCGYGGELSASMEESQEYEILREKIYCAHRLGVRKFRLTGGEPFLYPHIEELLELFNELGVYLLVNTNGSLVENYEELISKLQDNIHFVVSLDTNKEDMFNEISGTKNMFEKVKHGINILKETGRLYRLNMVVNKINKDEVFNIIDYCSEIGCNLKLLDVVSVPLPYNKRDNLHVSLIELEKDLEQKSEMIKNHQYARAFGTPCNIYRYKGVDITVKSTWNGSHYDVKGICHDCKYFPCHEGLYDIFALPDQRVVGCRWSEESVAKSNKLFAEGLEEMATIFQRAIYVPRKENPAMIPKPDFVVNFLKKSGEKVPEIYIIK